MSSASRFVCCCVTYLGLAAANSSQAAEYCVSPTGKDDLARTGSCATNNYQPWQTIQYGIDRLSQDGQDGDILSIRAGVYVVSPLGTQNIGIHIKKTAKKNITVRAYQNPITGIIEPVTIDGAYAEFLNPSGAWQPAPSSPISVNEWISTKIYSLPEQTGIRGAFVSMIPFTRLISYSRAENLRSLNETFPTKDPFDPAIHDHRAYQKCGGIDTQPPCTIANPPTSTNPKTGVVQKYQPLTDADENLTDGRRWVYMGPGIWYERNGSSGRIHVRLDKTKHIGFNGILNYNGGQDPNAIQLSISPENFTTLVISGTTGLTIRDITIRGGGVNTVQISGTTNTRLINVQVLASTNGIRTSTFDIGAQKIGNTNLMITNSLVDGGRPTWYFRTDRKSEYYMLDPSDPTQSTIVNNGLGASTLGSLLLPNNHDNGTLISYNEFRAGHDLYLKGSNTLFTRNWVHDLNDEGLVLDFPGEVDPVTNLANPNSNVRIERNAFHKVVSAISFGNDTIDVAKADTGKKYIYRNLVDLRQPILYTRPKSTDPAGTSIFVYGDAFKPGGIDPPYALFQNTFLVYKQTSNEAYLHFQANPDPALYVNERRRSFNNIFIAVNPVGGGSDGLIARLPSPTFPAETDGNNYWRIGEKSSAAYQFIQNLSDQGYQNVNPKCSDSIQNGNVVRTKFCDLGPLYRSSNYFSKSMLTYPPGYEANSVEMDPLFRSIDASGVFSETDHLVLRSVSSMRNRGINLPPDLQAIDIFPSGIMKPDIGAYSYRFPALGVGRFGRERY